jgi:uncharacterized protein YhaN
METLLQIVREGVADMRTSDRLPEECREEIRARLSNLKANRRQIHELNIPRHDRMLHEHIEKLRIEELAWVLGEGEGGKEV